MARLCIYGCGGHGREMLHAARDDPREKVFVSDDGSALAPSAIALADELCIAISDAAVRRRLAMRHSRFATIVAPTAVIDPTAALGEGAQICDFAFVGANARLGRHVIVNVRAHIHHDCVVGDFVTISPGAMCMGNVVIEDGAFIGAGAIVRNGTPASPTVIGLGATVGMGAVVTRSVLPKATVVGNPAKPLLKPVHGTFASAANAAFAPM